MRASKIAFNHSSDLNIHQVLTDIDTLWIFTKNGLQNHIFLSD